jgi:hypothetical protein
MEYRRGDIMRKIKLPIQENITNDLIVKLIENHSEEKSRILKLKEYYKNNNAIKERTQTDINKPNNLLLFCIIYGFGVNNIRIKAKGD